MVGQGEVCGVVRSLPELEGQVNYFFNAFSLSH